MVGEHVDSGYVLHERTLSDSKRIYRIFTCDTGLVSAVFRVGKHKSLSCFQPYDISWFGRSDLKTLKYAESSRSFFPLQGKALFCGLYLNELLTRALQQEQCFPELFVSYENALHALASHYSDASLVEVILRRFEFLLLAELGVGLSFEETANGDPIIDSPDCFYLYDSGSGFLIDESCSAASSDRYSGVALRAIASERWEDNSLRVAKRLARVALMSVIGTKPLKSREMFQ